MVVKAAPNSLVAVKAVDKRLDLLQENPNDVTVDAVKDALDRSITEPLSDFIA